jgi:hypothetical protein
MEIETGSRSESRIALAMNVFLSIVLAASLIAGGRQIATASPSYGLANTTNTAK